MIEAISLGAGVQSTTLALMAAHGLIEPMPDVAIFADTGAEPPEVYEHLAWLGSGNVLPFPIFTVQFSNMTEDLQATARGEVEVAGRKGGYLAAPFFTRNADGSAGMLRRECTQNYKIRRIEHGLKEWMGRDPQKTIRSKKVLVRQWIGISTDEIARVKWKAPPWQVKRFPFLERHLQPAPGNLWMSRDDCLTWLIAHGYSIPPKSACTYCPFRSNAEWRWLRDNSPEGWAEAVAMDALIRDMPAKSRAGLRLGGQLFVHEDRVPLDQVDLDRKSKNDLWAGECEGMCGV